MKNLLLISFDIIREADPKISLSIGSLLAYLKNDNRYGKEFTVNHISFNLYDNTPLSIDKIMDKITSMLNLANVDSIAISCYIWSEYMVNQLISTLRANGFKKNIILGGNQISYIDTIQRDYPDCQIFIFGYGEGSLLKSIFYEKLNESVYLNNKLDFSSLPSPYLSNVIPIEKGQKKVRLETKRGCPYSCSFCAHQDLQRKKVYYRIKEMIFNELVYLKEKFVGKINVIDPTFNFGPNYLEILEHCIEIGFNSPISLQVRFDNIQGEEGSKFLELCSDLNVILEFGLQTIHKNELEILNRKNDLAVMESVMNELNKKNIKYEVNLMYGIPNQTLASFQTSINFLRDNGCNAIKAHSLKLLKGTQLWYRRDEWRCVEEI